MSYDGEDMFLKLETARRGWIKGESRDARHAEEIGIDDWAWGMEAGTGLSGQGRLPKATIKPLHIMIRVDRASMALMSTLHNNALIKKGVLSVCKAGRPAYFKIIFENARITFLEVRTLTWDGQPALVVYLSFSFQEYRVEYVRQNKEGAQGGTIIGDPGPVLVAGLVGSLKGILQGAKKAGPSDKTPDAPDKPPRTTTTLHPPAKFEPKQVQAKFKHAKDFGIDGPYNKENAQAFEGALKAQTESLSTQTIKGTYRGQEVFHKFDTSTGRSVILDKSGNFVSGWKLDPVQIEHLLKTGKIGGG